jgi:membrane-anchored mycosin MYCP
VPASSQPWKVDGGPYEYKTEDLVVRLENLRTVLAKLDEIHAPHDQPVISELLGLGLIRLRDSETTADRIKDLVKEAQVKYGGSVVLPQTTDTSPLGKIMWGLRSMFAVQYAGWQPELGKNRLVGFVHGVGEVWHGGGGIPGKASQGFKPSPRAQGPGRGVRVGILDTRLYAHPWLAGAWVARYSDLLQNGTNAPVSAGHGTFVAGCVLGQAPGATVEVRRVLDQDGKADSWSVAREIVLLGRSGVDVLNLSFLCHTEDGQPPMVLSAAIDRLDPELVVVAAAGNHGDIPDSQPGQQANVTPSWPAALSKVVAVGASDTNGKRATFSPDAPWVDLLTLGVDVRSTYLESVRIPSQQKLATFGGFAKWSGTSFAAARVSGAIAAGSERGRRSGRAALDDILDAAQPHGKRIYSDKDIRCPVINLPVW